MRICAAVFVIVCLVVLTACDEHRYLVYENVPAAQEEEMFAKGWFPAWIPEDAANLHIKYDLDTSARAISFMPSNPEDFTWPTYCLPARSEIVAKPRFKTRLFPGSIQNVEGILDCDDLLVVQDLNGIIHMWSD